MKITALFLFVTIMQVHATVYGQKLTLKQKNINIVRLFEEIEKQTGYDVLYSPKVINASIKINADFNDTPLDQVLKISLVDQQVIYTIDEKTIVIKKKEGGTFIEKLLSPLTAIDIHGRVVDEKGVPLAGARVKVKGTDRSTSTDNEGMFSLNSLAEDAVLQISFLGYKSREVKASQVANTNIKLELEINKLEEVAISTGYQTIKPERFVGSATVVDSTILERQVGRNLFERLDGTANGLLFNKTTGSLEIQLRGVATLNTNTDLNGLSSQNPLIILDDFPFTGSIQNINPNNIESVSILKDAVAMSIWGARAANGVVVIKSKSGKYNNPISVDISSNFSIQPKPNLNYFPRLNSSEFIDLETDLFNKGFFDLNIMFPQYFSVSPVVDLLGQARAGTISQEKANLMINDLRQVNLNEEAEKYIYRNGTSYQNFINLSSGSDKLSYNLSLGADNAKSSIIGPGGSDRYTLSSNARLRPVQRVELSIGVDYNTDRTIADGISYPTFLPGRGFLYPYARLVDKDGNHLSAPTTFGTEFLNSLPTDKILDWSYRPLDERDNVNQVTKTNLLRLNFGAGVKITSWLTTDFKYQYTTQGVTDRNLRSEQTYFTRDLINSYTDPSTFVRNIPLGGVMDISETGVNSHNLRGQANVRKNWAGVHDFTALVAGELSQTSSSQDFRRMYGYDEKSLRYVPTIDYVNDMPLFNGGASRIQNYAFIQKLNTNLVSLLMNASYTYDSRYGVYVSARKDGSNLFGVNTNNKYKPLWSAGGRWNLHNEKFFKVTPISQLTIRATYGYAGNINNSIPAISTILAPSAPNSYGQSFKTVLTAPNPDLRWEQTSTVNLGLDLGFFKNRIVLNMEVYRKKSSDVVTQLPSDPTLGLTGGSIYKNAANLTTRGFDLAISSRNLVGVFKWSTNVNLNYAKTVVSRYFQEVKNVPNAPVIREGDVYLGVYAYRWAGLDPTTGDPRGYVGNAISSNYQEIFNDSLKNQQYVGAYLPLLFGNMMNTFSYKSFTLSANISFRAKYYYQKPALNYTTLFNAYDNHGDYRDRWQKPGDENITNVPSMPYPADENRDKFYKYSSVNFERGDHIRLQDIRLGYNWVNNNHKMIPVKSIEMFAYAGNLNFILWKASNAGYDPNYPSALVLPAKTFSLGLNFKL